MATPTLPAGTVTSTDDRAGGGPPSSGRALLASARRLAPLWRWVLLPLLTMLIASAVVFFALALAPGDPLAQALGSHPTAESRALLEAKYGLDRPLVVQYLSWLSGVLHGDFGTSIVQKASVWSLIAPRISVTLSLVAYAGVLVVVGGLASATLGTMVKPLGPLVTVVSAIGVAVPAYVAASVLSLLFVIQLGWFPALGAGDGLGDRLYHLTLPAIALAIGWGSYLSQVGRAALREESDREHVETARARGLSAGTVFRRHVLRNAAVPIVTVSALAVAALVVGATVVETAFGIDGLGSFFVTAVSNKDYASVEAVSLLLVVLFVLLTTALDAVHTLLDPRLRTPGASR
ncbi:ABC transporter permease [Nocardioides sp. GY 10127]|uniref:ABC transporter permease n=1 Tax=Nocardioides sp. GY 10127 TaxID=2569762 RepID=UPI0010A7EAC4|nr:ABC transporter permease [Nocardioides sp. GY 10127]TIC79117.1 ABC transporter permease [Nocardioides sp. GY 10127]